jgi:hypothetical protein
MKFNLLFMLLLISFTTKSEPLLQWIAKVPVYPDPLLFDPKVTLEECDMLGSMASSVQIARKESRDTMGVFLIRMPEELKKDNYGFPQPIVSYYYSQIGEWIFDSYDISEPVDNVMHDYTKQCIRQSIPSDLDEWFELKKRNETEQEKQSWGA